MADASLTGMTVAELAKLIQDGNLQQLLGVQIIDELGSIHSRRPREVLPGVRSLAAPPLQSTRPR